MGIGIFAINWPFGTDDAWDALATFNANTTSAVKSDDEAAHETMLSDDWLYVEPFSRI